MTLNRGISLIICCYNSSNRIKPTLEHLALQDISEEVPCEIIVVNNASTDDLQVVVEDTWSKCGSPYPLKVVFEPTPGLAFARRCGVQQAKYSYGVFCDDDNWLAPTYLTKVAETFDAKPKVGLVGGCSTPVFESEPPAWFYTQCSSYAIGVQAPETGDITHRGFVWGAGMGFRLNVLKSIYEAGINPLVSDRTKTTLTSGGDGEIGAWFIFAGYRIWYDSELKFQHFIPEKRLTSSYYQSFFSVNYSSLWPSYHEYIILKYGVFYHPKRKKLLRLYPAIRRVKAFLWLIKHYANAVQVQTTLLSLQKISSLHSTS
jgi:glycosyltransferase involved in cell wall biosynthesis